MTTEPRTPTIGQIVHYVSYGTPGGEYTSRCRAAMVTEVGAWVTMPGAVDEGVNEAGQRVRDVTQVWHGDACHLDVRNPTGGFFNLCLHDEGAETPGSPDCPMLEQHGNPFRYCDCGWLEGSQRGGTWHWPEEGTP